MGVSKAELTVYFDPPFWVGLYQREEWDGVQVCRVVFGGKPKDQQVLDWFQSHFRELRFSPPVAGGRSPDRAVNPKRARRGRRRPSAPQGRGQRPSRPSSSSGSR